MITRRQALRLGITGGLGLVFSRFLEAPAFADATSAPAGKAKHVILLWMNGGPSHIDTWDPKTGKNAGPHKAIKTSVPGLMISEHMPQLARMANKLAVIRGMTSKEGNHVRANYLLHTGYSPNPTVEHPSFGAWMSKRLGEPSSGLPSFVSLNGTSHGGGFFGVQHGPYVVKNGGEMPADVAPAVDDPRFEARKKLLGDMEDSFAKQTGDLKVEGRRELYAKADRLMHAKSLDAFDVSKETEAVRKSYGDSAFGKACLTAARLVTNGVRCVEVTLDGWDTHKNGFERTKKLMGDLDPAMSGLLADLERRGKLSETLVVWMGDFGRTPRINATEGRDHYPAAWSAVLAGGGIRGGVVHGETDAEGARVVKDPVVVPNLLATIATPLGLNPADTMMSPIGRPISLTENGAPIKAVLL
ncbi:MAG: DUF1501 domain-containing protein [Labilithrix sp.]